MSDAQRTLNGDLEARIYEPGSTRCDQNSPTGLKPRVERLLSHSAGTKRRKDLAGSESGAVERAIRIPEYGQGVYSRGAADAISPCAEGGALTERDARYNRNEIPRRDYLGPFPESWKVTYR